MSCGLSTFNVALVELNRAKATLDGVARRRNKFLEGKTGSWGRMPARAIKESRDLRMRDIMLVEANS